MLKNNIQTLVSAWLFSTYIGQDELGNKYYQHKRFTNGTKRYNKRWVIYAHEAEASSVPATWHGWLHHNCDQPVLRKQDHPITLMQQKNATGTVNAYFPPFISNDGKIPENNVKGYHAWQPHKR